MKKVSASRVVTGQEASASPLPPQIQEALGDSSGAAREGLLALTAALRQAATRHGAVLVDFGADRAASNPRPCSVDRLHANQAGHARIAAALGVPDSDDRPAAALPAAAGARRPSRPPS